MGMISSAGEGSDRGGGVKGKKKGIGMKDSSLLKSS